MEEQIKKTLKMIGKAIIAPIKVPLKIIGVIVLMVVIIVGAFFRGSAETIKSSEGVGEMIRSSVRYENGEIIIEDTLYQSIREKLVATGWDSEKEYKLDDETLKKMVHADIVTNYPYTGKRNIEGRVYIKRTEVNGYLEYLPPTGNGSFEEKRQEAENNKDFNIIKPYFTVDDSDMGIIIAKYQKTTVKESTKEGEEGEINSAKGTYTIGTEKLQYWSEVTGYSMPYEFLYTLLVITRNPEYVVAVADLALQDTKIHFTVLDSTSTVTTEEEYWWKEQTTTEYLGEEGGDPDNPSSDKTPNIHVKTDPKYTKTTMEEETNSVRGEITYVKNWIISKDKDLQKEDGIPEVEYPLSPDGSPNRISKGNGPEETYIDELKKITFQNIDIEEKVTKIREYSDWVSIPKTDNIDPSTFLGLWRNETGEYDPNNLKPFKSKEDGGIEVKFYVSHRNANVAPAPNIVDQDRAFFWYLRQTSRTQSYEQIMKYVLQVYTGNDYGVLEEDLLHIFENMKSFGYMCNSLVEYIKSWENGALWEKSSYAVGKWITADSKNYIVYEDGSNGHNNIAYGIATFITSNKNIQVKHPTYGWGYYNHQAGLSKRGIDVKTLSEGALVPVEAVDTYFNEYVQEKLKDVEGKTNGLGLTRNQIDALVSISYQFGNIGNFVDAYKQCGDTEELRNNFIVYGHNGLCPFNIRSGSEAERSAKNWKLFHEGIYQARNGKIIPANNFGDFLQVADQAHEYMEKNSYTYSLSLPPLPNSFAQAETSPYTCCATYVSWVLYLAGYTDQGSIIHSCSNLEPYLKSKGFEKITSYSELQPGDIVFTDNDSSAPITRKHVQIYAGDNTWFNAGSTDAIRRASPYSQGNWAKTNFVNAYRLK